MILKKSKLLDVNSQIGRDDRLQVRTLDNRRHKTQEEAKPEKLSKPQVQSGPISQVKGDLEAQCGWACLRT